MMVIYRLLSEGVEATIVMASDLAISSAQALGVLLTVALTLIGAVAEIPAVTREALVFAKSLEAGSGRRSSVLRASVIVAAPGSP